MKKNGWKNWGIVSLVLVPLFFIFWISALTQIPIGEEVGFFCEEDQEAACLDKSKEYYSCDTTDEGYCIKPDEEIAVYNPTTEQIISCLLYERGACYNPTTEQIFTCAIGKEAYCE